LISKVADTVGTGRALVGPFGYYFILLPSYEGNYFLPEEDEMRDKRDLPAPSSRWTVQ
jgi:hypothetical protein